MRLELLTSLLLTILFNDWRARARDIREGDASYTRLVAELDAPDTGRTGLDFVLFQNLNLTTPGKRRGTKRNLPRALLEVRQDNQTCTQPGFILTCPITEHAPCCDPGFPVCCHDPSDTCCPDGFFCSGLATCCRDGAIGCGEGCCPGTGYTCQTVSGTPTCVEGAGSSAVSNTLAPVTSGVGQSASGSTYPTATSSPPAASPPNNTPIIAGAVGGGVGALLIIGLIAWFLLRKKPSKAATDSAQNTNPTPFTTSPPPMTSVSPPYQGNPLPMHKENHPWSATSPTNGYPYNVPYGISSPNGSVPPPGSTTGMTSTYEGVVGPGGYVPPPPEDAVPSTMSPGGSVYYTPLPATGPGNMHYFNGGATSNAGSSAYTPSRQDTISPDTTNYGITPWTAGVSPSPEQQPVWAQPVSPPSRVAAISPPPVGPMSPPPPFATDPPAFGGAGVTSGIESAGGGRQVPMTAPGDRKARASGAGAPAI